MARTRVRDEGWVSKDGSWVDWEDMDSNYARNVYNLLKRNGEVVPQGLIDIRRKFKVNKMNQEQEVVKSSIDHAGKYHLVVVKYQNSDKTYNFKIDPSIKPEEGDFLVAESTTGYGIVEVLKLHDNEYSNEFMKEVRKANAWIVCPLDFTDHHERVYKSNRRDYLLAKIEEKKAEIEENKILIYLSENDPEAAKMIKELKDIDEATIVEETNEGAK